MPPFQIHRKLNERMGALSKKGKFLKGWVTRWYHLQWDDGYEQAFLRQFKDDKFSKPNKKDINLKMCVIKAEPEKDIKDPANPLYNVTIYKRAPDESQGQKTVLAELWASTEIARDEWVDDLNKHAVNSHIENGYVVMRNSKLGAGAYSEVFKAKDRKSGNLWAVKEMDKTKLRREEVSNLKDEVRISQMVGSHDNIVYMKEFVENKDHYYIVLEFLTGGELFDRIVESPMGHFTEKSAADVMRQLMHALSYLHSKKIVHRDLKPENFLLANKTESSPIKIADFGFACSVEGEKSLRGLCGSPGYVAPEIIKEKEGYGLAVDMWSMGVILHILLSGIPPFSGESDEESFALTLRGHYDKANLDEISDEGKDLVAKCLTYNPSKRITAAETLQHPWIAGGAKDNVLKVQENLRSWRARMRFKKAIIATVATTRLHAIMRRAAARPDAKPKDETDEH